MNAEVQAIDYVLSLEKDFNSAGHNDGRWYVQQTLQTFLCGRSTRMCVAAFRSSQFILLNSRSAFPEAKPGCGSKKMKSAPLFIFHRGSSMIFFHPCKNDRLLLDCHPQPYTCCLNPTALEFDLCLSTKEGQAIFRLGNHAGPHSVRRMIVTRKVLYW